MRKSLLKNVTPAALALTFLFTLTAAHSAAAADEDASWFRLGKVNVVPTLALDLGYTSNLYRESTTSPTCEPIEVCDPLTIKEAGCPTSTDFDPNSSMVTDLTAGLRFLLPAGDFTLGAGGYAVWHWYEEDSGQNSTDYKVFGSVGGDFPGGLAFILKDTYEYGWLLESFEFGEGEHYRLNELRLDSHYTFHDEMRLRFEWVNYLYDYENSKDRDRTENILTGTFYRRVAPKTAALAALDYAVYDYDDNPRADNDSIQISGGLTWEATHRGTAILQAGYEWKNYDINTVVVDDETVEVNDDGQYYTFLVGWRHLLGRSTSARLDFERRSIESDFQDNPYFVRSSFRAGVGHRFLRRFTIEGDAGIEFDDYPNSTTLCDETRTREDTTGIIGGRLSFDVIRRVRLGVRLEYESRDSNFAILDYDDTRVFFTIAGGLPLDWLRPRRR